MRWDELPRSDNIEDRRGDDGGGFGGGFGGPVRTGGLGIGTIVVLGLIGWALGIDPRLLIGGAEMIGNRGDQYEQPYQESRGRTGTPTDQTGQFVSAILGSADAEWKDIFAKAGQTYRPPHLVMFSGATSSACGFAQSAMGPFYCPSDQKIYLDTSFFRDLQTRFRGCEGRACQFAQAYVITHEVGHHVQNLLGILPKVQRQQRIVDKAQANHLQVRVELQADCLAGVWANHSDQRWKLIEPGDVEAALQTASAIGDDRLQKQRQGYVVPDAFTHGSSAQRVRWFRTGLQQGTIGACNTFSDAQL
ncbi:MAG TPA: neutral zinc metallopeptidase [Xanthobacteraceae bacterium]|nr:neutral zinc metallopeptidase [Xanthobacteraceae bacterium]